VLNACHRSGALDPAGRAAPRRELGAYLRQMLGRCRASLGRPDGLDVPSFARQSHMRWDIRQTPVPVLLSMEGPVICAPSKCAEPRGPRREENEP